MSPDRAWTRQEHRRGWVCGSRGVKRESIDKGVQGELAAGKPFDGAHDATARRTWRQGHARRRRTGRRDRHRRWWIRIERLSAAWKRVRATARGQKTVEADPHETFRQYMETEAPEEFLRAECHQSDLTPMAIVLPPKCHVAVRHGDQSMIGNRDPVRVPGQIVKHVARAAERGLGVDDPLVPKKGAEPRGECRLGGQALEVFRHREPACAKRSPETRNEFPTKHATEDVDRQKE